MLLPTPPLPDATAITFLTPGRICSGARGVARRTVAPHAIDEGLDADRVQSAADLGLDLVLERARGRGQLDRERDVGAVDDEVADHVAGDEVAAELGLLDGAEGVEDGGLGDGAHQGGVRSSAAGRIVDRCTTRLHRTLGQPRTASGRPASATPAGAGTATTGWVAIPANRLGTAALDLRISQPNRAEFGTGSCI